MKQYIQFLGNSELYEEYSIHHRITLEELKMEFKRRGLNFIKEEGPFWDKRLVMETID